MTFQKIKEHSALPYIILGFLSLVWGSSFILMKKGLEAFTGPQVGTIRIFFAFLVMLPIALKHLQVFKTNWKKIFLLGLVSNFIPAILFAVAETGLSSSLAGILNSLSPLMAFLIGIFFFRSVMHKGQVLGLLIGLAGSISITFINSKGGLGSFNEYALYVIIATICYGINANVVKVHFSGINALILTSLIMFSLGPVSIAYIFSSDFIYRMQSYPGAWASLGYIFILGGVGTALAMVLYNRLIQITTAVFATSVTYVIPIVAVLWGILDGEQLFPLHFAGMLLIILGVYIINKFR